MPRARRSASLIKHQAGKLRVEPTEPESMLWAQLRDRRLDGIKFRRQHAIGRFVVDFCAPEQKLVVEVDGSQHLAQKAQDAERTAYLASHGYRVVRLWNDAVTRDMKAALETIVSAAREG